MYSAIVSAVESKILTNTAISGIIPSGTAIQNLRTSPLGDTLTRDGFHLSYGIGRYIAALTFFKSLTGIDIDNVKWTPDEVDDNARKLAIACANNSIKSPFGQI